MPTDIRSFFGGSGAAKAASSQKEDQVRSALVR